MSSKTLYSNIEDQQVVYMAMVGSFPFNSFLSGVLSCVGIAVLAGKSNFLSPRFAKVNDRF